MSKHVLVTGADGFIGSHLTEALVRRGDQVRALTFHNSFGTHGWLDHVDPAVRDTIEVVPGEIRDPNLVGNAARGRHTIFHLAAPIAIPEASCRWRMRRSLPHPTTTGTTKEYTDA